MSNDESEGTPKLVPSPGLKRIGRRTSLKSAIGPTGESTVSNLEWVRGRIPDKLCLALPEGDVRRKVEGEKLQPCAPGVKPECGIGVPPVVGS